MKLELRKIGNSYGIILPKKLLDALHVKQGDALYVAENDNGITLTPYNPDFEKAMLAYDKFSHQYKNALRELAK